MYHFVVKVPFADTKSGKMYEIGHRITDAELVAAIHDGELAHLQSHTIRVLAGAGPAPAAIQRVPAITLAQARAAAGRAPEAPESADRIYAPSR